MCRNLRIYTKHCSARQCMNCDGRDECPSIADENIPELVRDIIADALTVDRSQINDDDTNIVAKFGADSLDFQEILMFLEDEFCIEINDDQRMDTVGDIIRIVEDARQNPH